VQVRREKETHLFFQEMEERGHHDARGGLRLGTRRQLVAHDERPWGGPLDDVPQLVHLGNKRRMA